MSTPIPLDPDARRLALLSELSVLGTPPEDSFDTLDRCAATATGCSVAVLSLLGEDRLWFKAAYGVSETQCPVEGSFCSHAFAHNDLFVAPHAAEDARFSQHPWVIGPKRLNFYASVPVFVNGVRVGSLCVMDTQTSELTSTAQEVLWSLARLATGLLESRRHLTQLRHERERMSLETAVHDLQ